MREFYHRFLDKLFSSYAFRTRLLDTISDMKGSETQGALPPVTYAPDPYREPAAAVEHVTSHRDSADHPIILTSRFRSGSSLLWNMFHTLDGFTSYYEPLNERRWFLNSATAHVDPSHRGVSDYRANYDGMQDLDALFCDAWGERALMMHPQSADHRLSRYLDQLIAHAAHRPVLQFNRVDFRLPWLRAVYPHAKIIHLYRHPREQWVSMLYGQEVPRDVTLDQFEPYDRFYLLPWLKDLRRVFSCLDLPGDASPYDAHYLIWHLSYLYGRAYADISMSYEDLVASPVDTLSSALSAIDLDTDKIVNMSAVQGLVDGAPKNKRQTFAEDAWYAAKEDMCDARLQQMLSQADMGGASEPLPSLRRRLRS